MILKKKIGLQARWPGTLLLFFLPILVFLAIRSFLFEPFVIPSESMLPNLLVHDHIIVDKLPFGIKIPFMDKWLVQFSRPKSGDIVVFRYPENRDVYYIKRLIGVPGDEIKTQGMSVWVNGKLLELDPTEESQVFIEHSPERDYLVQFDGHDFNPTIEQEKVVTVPPDSYFVLGDNRFNSQDSRFWGFVSQDLFIGRARWIWLSCDEMLASAAFLCDPQTMRWNRVFKSVYVFAH